MKHQLHFIFWLGKLAEIKSLPCLFECSAMFCASDCDSIENSASVSACTIMDTDDTWRSPQSFYQQFHKIHETIDSRLQDKLARKEITILIKLIYSA